MNCILHCGGAGRVNWSHQLGSDIPGAPQRALHIFHFDACMESSLAMKTGKCGRALIRDSFWHGDRQLTVDEAV